MHSHIRESVFPAIFQKMDTSFGLSSIASLSLGLSMSMTEAGKAAIQQTATTPGNRRQSINQLYASDAVPSLGGIGGCGTPCSKRNRRPSFAGVLQQMSNTNHHPVRMSSSDRSSSVGDGQTVMVPSMERVLEESREDLSEGKPKESEERNDRLADGKKDRNDSGGSRGWMYLMFIDVIFRMGHVGGFNCSNLFG